MLRNLSPLLAQARGVFNQPTDEGAQDSRHARKQLLMYYTVGRTASPNNWPQSDTQTDTPLFECRFQEFLRCTNMWCLRLITVVNTVTYEGVSDFSLKYKLKNWILKWR